jgi:hypothetical protein
MKHEKVELYKAIQAVSKAVENIDKSMTVGVGQNAYKGVSDKDVKLIIGKAMNDNGLIMLPKVYNNELKIDRWEEVGNGYTKQKQSVFVECNAVYELIHVETGASVDIPAYGHGVDTQDKAAGKATTYALKYALLYAFLVPTGSIDDADKTHSDAAPVPQAKPQAKAPKTITNENFAKGLDKVNKGEMFVYEFEEKLKGYALTKEQQLTIESLKNKVNE